MKNKKQFLSAIMLVSIFSMQASEPADWGDPHAVDYASRRIEMGQSVTCYCATAECDGACGEITALEREGDAYARGYLQSLCCGITLITGAGLAAAMYAFGDADSEL